jgi:hypothetical protein
MCFALYAGTIKPIPEREWQEDAPDLNVQRLSDREAAIKTHFKSPEVRHIGSTSGCGCDFPHVMYQSGGWPVPWDEARNPNQVEVKQRNREALVKSLRETLEPTVELYGVWDGDFNFSEAPKVSEVISLEQILDPDFYFKEQGFYTVKIESRVNIQQ